ncbi:hypothetical protein, partial [Escherichia coli]|uniref:hypothetical protein n=1 Tax=Escherichia coli TaxID=562 RepID=UPI00200DAE1E
FSCFILFSYGMVDMEDDGRTQERGLSCWCPKFKENANEMKIFLHLYIILTLLACMQIFENLAKTWTDYIQ